MWLCGCSARQGVGSRRGSRPGWEGGLGTAQGSGPRAIPRRSASPQGRGAQPAQTKDPAPAPVPAASLLPPRLLPGTGKSEGQRGWSVHFLHSSREQAGGSSSPRHLVPHRDSRTRDPRQYPRTPPASAPQRPFRCALSSGLRLFGARCGRRSSEARGGRARGGRCWGRRSGGDTCGGAGGAGLGARGFKKVWRGAGAFPGLAEGRCAEAVAAAARRGLGDALSAPTDPAPLARGSKKLWEPGSPAELPCGAPLPSPLRSPPPPSRPPSARRLRPGVSKTE